MCVFERVGCMREVWEMVYERVETAKPRQMVELEKQRMQFAKDLEFQRMDELGRKRERRL